MKTNVITPRRARRVCQGLDQAGIALPVALLGLIAVSLMITAVIMSATTEVALSHAHQDATRSLYAAEGAIEALVARDRGALAPGSYPAFVAASGATPVNLTVTEVSSRDSGVTGVNLRRLVLQAEPVGGGRALTAMADTRPFGFDVTSSWVSGGNINLKGKAHVSDGSDSGNISCTGQVAPNAVVLADTASVKVQNNATVTGNVQNSGLTGEQLVKQALGNRSIRDFIRYVEATYGPAPNADYVTFGTNTLWNPSNPAPFRSTDKPRSWDNISSVATPRTAGNRYNWYCPGKMDDATNCSTVTGMDTTAYKIIVIDGGNNNVSIQGDHGQGLLIVINGRVVISGGFVFRGLVVAESDIDISGQGNKIDGAVVSQNTVNVELQTSSDIENETAGNTVIRYNKCALDNLRDKLGGDGAPVISPTFGWSELIR
jgi:cytoskeletal protein CcmA (bactofilin family)